LAFPDHGIQIRFIQLTTSNFLASEKASFMRSVLDEWDRDCEAVCYFDPDIVVCAPWTFFPGWLSRGIAVCEDNCFPDMSDTHFLRSHWKDFCRDVLNRTPSKSLSRSYNSGFVGVARTHSLFLREWEEATAKLEAVGVELSSFKPGDRLHPFHGTDQDALNIACMLTDSPLCTLGPEGMGFTPGMEVMWHAVEYPKPWRRRYLKSLLRSGVGVSTAHRMYWEHARGMLSPWTESQMFWHRVDLKLAIALSRFIHSA
jgi:hypothetical protein